MLCTTGIIYNTTMVDEAPTCWADLWDEQYAGNILMFNNSRDAYAIAAFTNGFLGLFQGGFKASAVGISAALIFGYLASWIFEPKMRK